MSNETLDPKLHEHILDDDDNATKAAADDTYEYVDAASDDEYAYADGVNQ